MDSEAVIYIEWSKRRCTIRRMVREFVSGVSNLSDDEVEVTKQTAAATMSK